MNTKPREVDIGTFTCPKCKHDTSYEITDLLVQTWNAAIEKCIEVMDIYKFVSSGGKIFKKMIVAEFKKLRK